MPLPHPFEHYLTTVSLDRRIRKILAQQHSYEETGKFPDAWNLESWALHTFGPEPDVDLMDMHCYAIFDTMNRVESRRGYHPSLPPWVQIDLVLKTRYDWLERTLQPDTRSAHYLSPRVTAPKRGMLWGRARNVMDFIRERHSNGGLDRKEIRAVSAALLNYDNQFDADVMEDMNAWVRVQEAKMWGPAPVRESVAA